MSKSVSHKPYDKPQHTLILLSELRTRLIYSLIVLFVTLTVCLFFSHTLYHWLAHPLLKYLPQGHLIATQMTSSFFVPFTLAFMAAIFLAMPFFLYQIWLFISPALYSHEKRWYSIFLIISIFLFYIGILFAYEVVFPILFHFLTRVVPEGVMMTPDIHEYLNFTIKLMFIFGVLFEIPIVMALLVITNVTTRQHYLRWRGYAFLTAFILAMLIAPPDILSQTLLAMPIYLLYELGILFSRFVSLKQQ